jgi:hypothetical protein
LIGLSSEFGKNSSYNTDWARKESYKVELSSIHVFDAIHFLFDVPSLPIPAGGE